MQLPTTLKLDARVAVLTLLTLKKDKHVHLVNSLVAYIALATMGQISCRKAQLFIHMQW